MSNESIKLLAEKLKALCDENGKEINTERTSPILNELGLLFGKRKDKVSLLQSAGLLNAVLVRQPLNSQARLNLDDLCWKILNLARAQIAGESLTNISLSVAEAFHKLRIETTAAVEKFIKIPHDVDPEDTFSLECRKIAEVQSVQNAVTQKYTEIMDFISQKCVIMMGCPPCKFTLLGMGSIARREITPYSDFESAIVLEEGQNFTRNQERCLEYFRWFSVLFQVILINLKETVLRFLAIPCLNDKTDWFFDAYTPCGVCPDGFAPHSCKNPLGRTERTNEKPWTTELIKPISEMESYLDAEEDVKNGYNLGDLLTKISFVSGDREVYDEFLQRIRRKLKDHSHCSHQQVLSQISENLKHFDAFAYVYGLQATSRCDIKRVVYRSLGLFISALGRLFLINDCSSFDIVQKLYRMQIIDQINAHKLCYAVAVACHVRLKVYSSKANQDDLLGQDMHYDIDDSELGVRLGDIVGSKSIIDFFIITYQMQQAIRKEDFRANLNRYLAPEPSNKFLVLYYLNFHERLLQEWKLHLMKHKEEFSFKPYELWIRWCVAETYRRKSLYSESIEMLSWFEQHQLAINNPALEGEVKIAAALCLLEMEKFKEAQQFSNQVRPHIQSLSTSSVVKSDQLRRLIGINADCKFMLKQYAYALVAFQDALQYFSHPEVPFRELRKVGCLSKIGWCYFHLGKFDLGINCLTEALKVGKEQKTPVAILCRCYWLLGCCYFKQSKYSEACSCLKQEIHLRAMFVPKDKQVYDEKIKRSRLAIKRMPINSCLPPGGSACRFDCALSVATSDDDILPRPVLLCRRA
ncbi:unnamed protein product [Clavelina lepadiformis]|uniref:Protein-PII uridylyltransferase N-terminal domain-containing protein n=1 Tax=Clavelina lepadiformis TaxID=159417 RepID=A0ABP0FI75_CLALP